MSEPDTKEVDIPVEQAPVTARLNKEIMRLSAENESGDNAGEIHTLNQVVEDLNNLPFAESAMDEYFGKAAEAAAMGETNLDVFMTTAKYSATRVDLPPESPGGFGRKGVLRVNVGDMESKFAVPDEIKNLADLKDGDSKVINGWEIGVGENGDKLYMSEPTFKMILKSYSEPDTSRAPSS